MTIIMSRNPSKGVLSPSTFALYATSTTNDNRSQKRTAIRPSSAPPKRQTIISPSKQPKPTTTTTSTVTSSSSSSSSSSQPSATLSNPLSVDPPSSSVTESTEDRLTALAVHCVSLHSHHQYSQLVTARITAVSLSKLAYGRADAEVTHAQCRLAEAYRLHSQFKQAITHAKQALYRATTLLLTNTMYNGNVVLSKSYLSLSILSSVSDLSSSSNFANLSYQHAQSALHLTTQKQKQNDDSITPVSAYQCLGDYYCHVKNYDEAVEYYTKLYTYFEKEEGITSFSLVDVYIKICHCYYQQKKYDVVNDTIQHLIQLCYQHTSRTLMVDPNASDENDNDGVTGNNGNDDSKELDILVILQIADTLEIRSSCYYHLQDYSSCLSSWQQVRNVYDRLASYISSHLDYFQTSSYFHEMKVCTFTQPTPIYFQQYIPTAMIRVEKHMYTIQHHHLHQHQQCIQHIHTIIALYTSKDVGEYTTNVARWYLELGKEEEERERRESSEDDIIGAPHKSKEYVEKSWYILKCLYTKKKIHNRLTKEMGKKVRERKYTYNTRIHEKKEDNEDSNDKKSDDEEENKHIPESVVKLMKEVWSKLKSLRKRMLTENRYSTSSGDYNSDLDMNSDEETTSSSSLSSSSSYQQGPYSTNDFRSKIEKAKKEEEQTETYDDDEWDE